MKHLKQKDFDLIKSLLEAKKGGANLSKGEIAKIAKKSPVTVIQIGKSASLEDYRQRVADYWQARKQKKDFAFEDKPIKTIEAKEEASNNTLLMVLIEIRDEIKILNTLIRKAGGSNKFRLW